MRRDHTANLVERKGRNAVQTSMRRWFSFIPFFLLAGLSAVAGTVTDSPEVKFPVALGGRPATADELARIRASLLQVARDQNHWAYTQTMVIKDDKGRVRETTVVRFDPSKPYPEQYTPLVIEGRPPTEKQLKEYRQKGEKRGQRLEQPEMPRESSNKWSLRDAVDISSATVVREDDQIVDYELPLRKLEDGPFPPEKFQVIARFDRAAGRVENVAVRLREPVRAKLVVKIKSGDATIDFTTVDPKFAPAMTAVHGDASGSILFVNVGADFALTRSDLKRVKPYGDRFGVEIGPTQALDF
jgi:hypothetical protein